MPKDIVHSKKDALDWFLGHKSGPVICVAYDGAEVEANSYREAKEFFEKHGE